MILYDYDRKKFVEVYETERTISMKSKVYFDVNDKNYKYGMGYNTNIKFLSDDKIVKLLNENNINI